MTRKHLALDYDGPMSKECVACGQIKFMDEFSRDRQRRDGRRSYCKPCARQKHYAWADENKKELAAYARLRRKNNPDYGRDVDMRRRYDIGLADYRAMNEAQQGLCGICGLPEHDHKKNSGLVPDHDHATGRVRGLLCGRCNSGLGLFKDNPTSLRKAAAYLEVVMPDANS